MVFSSIVFLLYFLPIFLIIYYIADIKYKNTIILLFSIVFYAWGAPKFIFALLGVTFLDFHFVQWMYESKKKWVKIVWLLASLTMNLGLLLYFKYFNFFIENINAIAIALTGQSFLHTLKIMMPIGISFYTFETITYVVDVYRRIHKPLKNFWDYQLYIILFPKLIAGPIIKFHDIADQITNRFENFSSKDIIIGFNRFCIGLAKKVLIANNVGIVADKIFDGNIENFSSSQLIIGVIAYSFQIYFDFSGYSDMAIGLMRMMGFRIFENFDNPYISKSITEFWRRWHISLGKWMKEYLYIPLGGNRISNTSTYLNLLLVFLVSGIWHGAAWNFIFWGAYHGFFLIIERLFLLNFLKRLHFVSLLYSFIIAAIGWIFFRSNNLTQGFQIIISILSKPFEWNSINLSFIDLEQRTAMIIAGFFSFFCSIPFLDKIHFYVFFNEEKKITISILLWITSIFLLIVSISYITTTNFNPFIYFRF